MNINKLRDQNMTFVGDNLTMFYIGDLCNDLYVLVHNKTVRNVYKYIL